MRNCDCNETFDDGSTRDLERICETCHDRCRDKCRCWYKGDKGDPGPRGPMGCQGPTGHYMLVYEKDTLPDVLFVIPMIIFHTQNP